VRTSVVELRPKADRLCRDCGVGLTEANCYPSCWRKGQRCCKKCWNERFYLAVRKHKYGMDREEFEGMLAAVNGRCVICDEVMRENGVCVDHDHRTGFVRGLLCQHCNSGLGFFRDDPERLEWAAAYLEVAREIDRREWYMAEYRARGGRGKRVKRRGRGK